MASKSRVLEKYDSVKCQCGAGDCVVRISQTMKNPNRPYYSCPLGMGHDKSCRYFLWVDELVQCPCGKGPCRRRTSHTSETGGRVFYVCPQSTPNNLRSGCGFFKWAEEIPKPSVGVECAEERNLLEDVKQTLEKEKYAAEMTTELCERVLSKLEKLHLRG